MAIVGGGLAGCECALQLAKREVKVILYEMRGVNQTSVHRSDMLSELVCSNSLKSTKASSAAGLLKHELELLDSKLYAIALKNRVAAGGALAVDRDLFARDVTRAVESSDNIEIRREEVASISDLDEDLVVLSSGPMTSPLLAEDIMSRLDERYLNFYDAAAPIVEADSIDLSIAFRSNRYEDEGSGDYLNCPMDKQQYERFIAELLNAEKVILKDFENRELFSACQPIEEIARSGFDAPRFGPMKPVGLIDPRSGFRPYAAVQLRSENDFNTAYNLVGFQTNLTFAEQKRVFRMIPALDQAEFSRFGVMHKNIYIDAPKLLDATSFCSKLSRSAGKPIFVAGQLSGTEGYVEAIRSGLNTAIYLYANLLNLDDVAQPPLDSVFGALMMYATSSDTKDYQPMHVNFGILRPLKSKIRRKSERYDAYAQRANEAMQDYVSTLRDMGVL